MFLSCCAVVVSNSTLLYTSLDNVLSFRLKSLVDWMKIIKKSSVSSPIIFLGAANLHHRFFHLKYYKAICNFALIDEQLKTTNGALAGYPTKRFGL